MSAAGVRVSVGRLRVDAARAVDKLRQYQLPDPVAWVLEVVRAAVAFGATAIRVSGDADDVRVAWDGPAPDAESMAHLFDELVDPAPRASRRAHRLLATGVNTALGLGPRWVDVIVTDGDGGALEVRYKPSLLETTGGAAEGLRTLTAAEVLPPPEAPRRGGLVHLKRLPLWDAVPLMVGYGEPRELSIVRRSCDDMSTPIVVGSSTLAAERSHGDLLRIELGDGLDGFLALVDPSTARRAARLDAAELGVILARYTLPLEGFSDARARLPVRLFINAERMPTNASRSAVRLDDPPMGEAIEQTGARFVELVERLAVELGETPEHEHWSPTQRERLRAAALSLLAAFCAGSDWRARLLGAPGFPPLPAALSPLMKLALLRDALGRTRTPESFPMIRGEERVHFGADPVARQLEPWLGDSLWVPPGDPAAALLGSWVPPKASMLAIQAWRYRSRRRRFLGQRKRKPRLPRSREHLVVVPLRAPGRSVRSLVPEAWFDIEGLAGEVALLHPQERNQPVLLLLDGREIAHWQPEVAMKIAGVATCEGLTPKVDCTGIRLDDQLARLQRALCAGLVVACESLALAWTGKKKRGDFGRSKAKWIDGATGKEAERVTSTLRAGVLLALELHSGRTASGPEATRERAVRTLISSKSPLATTPIWPKVGGGLVSTRKLLGQGDVPPRVIGYHTGRPSREAALEGGRPVYELTPHEQKELQWYLPAATMISYAPALLRPPRLKRLARLAAGPFGVALEVSAKGLRAAISIGGASSRLEVRHWGRTLARCGIADTKIAMTVIVDDALVIPDDDFRGIREVPGESRGSVTDYPIDAWLVALAKAHIDALAGDTVPNLFIATESAADAVGAREALLGLIGVRPEPEKMLGKKRFARLKRIPLLRRLGLPGYATLAEVDEARHDGPLHWLPVSDATSVDLRGWHPVTGSLRTAEACAKILGCELENGEERLEGLRKVARRRRALAAHRMVPERDPTSSWTGTTVEVKGRGIRRAVAKLARSPGARVSVYIEGRPFRELAMGGELPVVLFLDLPPSAADDDFLDVGEVGHRRIRYAVRAAARALLTRAAKEAPRSLTRSPDVLSLLEEWCAHLRACSGGDSAERKARQTIADSPAFPTVRGGYVPIAEAATGGDTLRLARWDESWIEAAPGGRPSAYDGAILDIVDGRDEYRALLKTLWNERPTRDVTNAISRLQSTRRVARALVSAPRLLSVRDSRFRYSLATILDEGVSEQRPALEALGVGEVALAEDRGCKIHFFARGRRADVLELALVPAVHVATHSPLVRKRGTLGASSRKKIEAATQTLIGLVVRRVVDETPPDELPVWVRDQLRDSSLRGGELYFERLASTPMFQTSVGQWVTPEDVKDQVERFGAVWTTTLRDEIAPLDPLRLAIRLSSSEAGQLEDWMPTRAADDELRWDREARANMERPAVPSLDATATERESALATVVLEAKGEQEAHGTIVLLKPGSTVAPALHVSRSLRPLGTSKPPHKWPIVARIDDPRLTPNRTWSAPQEDEALSAVRSRVRTAVDAQLSKLVPFPFQKTVAMRFRSSVAKQAGLPQGVAIEAVIYLEPEVEPGELTLTDPRGERPVAAIDRKNRALPIHGVVLASRTLSQRELGALGELFHARLVLRLAQRLATKTAHDRDAKLLHLLTALRAGMHVPADALEKVTLSRFVHPGPLSVLGARRHVDDGGFVAVCAPDELERAKKAELEAPVFVNDGSPAATIVLGWLGGRAIDWRSYMRGRVLEGMEMEAVRDMARAASPATKRGPKRKQLHPLATAMLARWSSLSLPELKSVVIDGRRSRPAVLWSKGGHLVLAGRHPAVRDARLAAETRDADLDARVTLIVARAIGSYRRDGGRLGAPGEESLLLELMLPARDQ